jgi:hypothetical protein
MEIKITATRDKNCTGRRQHYVVGDKDSSISGGLYLERKVEQPERITIIFKKDKNAR